MGPNLSFPTLGSESMESEPLDHQEVPREGAFFFLRESETLKNYLFFPELGLRCRGAWDVEPRLSSCGAPA